MTDWEIEAYEAEHQPTWLLEGYENEAPTIIEADEENRNNV